jgi:cysteine-rich repeat protein
MRAALLLVVISRVVSFDLDAFRQSTVVSNAAHLRPVEWDNAFRRYQEPLGYPNFLPLCGNGVLNTKADYVAMYANGYPLLDVSGRVPGVSVKIMADEACDDGNRFDGDGCSADCMDADLFQSVCEAI